MRVQLIGLHLLYNLVSAAPTLREPLKSLGNILNNFILCLKQGFKNKCRVDLIEFSLRCRGNG
jgi:hypothetical protein